MLSYVLRRLGWAALTIFGVMIFTFLLFRVGSGDIAAAWVGEKGTEQRKADWRHTHGYDLPVVVNVHRNLLIVDKTSGAGQFRVKDEQGSAAADSLALILTAAPGDVAVGGKRKLNGLMGRYVFGLDPATPIEKLLVPHKGLLEEKKPTEPESEPPIQPASASSSAPASASQATLATAASGSAPATAPEGAPATQAASTPSIELVRASFDSQPAATTATSATTAPAAAAKPPPLPPGPLMVFSLADGTTIAVSVQGLRTAGDLIRRINKDPANQGRLEARLTDLSFAQVFNSQFFHHLRASVFFESRSLKDNKTLTEIIAQHGPASLAVQIPALALEWCLGLAISCFVAYYRGTLVDKIGVLVTVLGMCIPFLAFMIFGQWAMFAAGLPQYAYGLAYRGNVYVPIAIMVAAGLGGNVRFYRTVILDETGRDYVRTAKAKGLPLPTILFRHVLRNCMLPILTSLILSIPFLIMGGLLVESYFGIPGLGDLMLTSIDNRNEPIMNSLVYLTALVYTLGILLTDISYAIFDPRIRLR